MTSTPSPAEPVLETNVCAAVPAHASVEKSVHSGARTCEHPRPAAAPDFAPASTDDVCTWWRRGRQVGCSTPAKLRSRHPGQPLSASLERALARLGYSWPQLAPLRRAPGRVAAARCLAQQTPQLRRVGFVAADALVQVAARGGPASLRALAHCGPALRALELEPAQVLGLAARPDGAATLEATANAAHALLHAGLEEGCVRALARFNTTLLRRAPCDLHAVLGMGFTLLEVVPFLPPASCPTRLAMLAHLLPPLVHVGVQARRVAKVLGLPGGAVWVGEVAAALPTLVARGVGPRAIEAALLEGPQAVALLCQDGPASSRRGHVGGEADTVGAAVHAFCPRTGAGEPT